MVREKIEMNYRICIIRGRMPKLRGAYKSIPFPPDRAMEIFDILLEDSDEGRWLRGKKRWLDKIIHERSLKDYKKE